MAVGGGGGADSRSLEETPTWAVAIVCLSFVVISLLLERAIHLIAKWLQKRKKKSLSKVLEKLKAELMLLGFISLLLSVGQRPISKICISKSLGDSFLPCSKDEISSDDAGDDVEHDDDSMDFSLAGHNRKLLFGGDAIYSDFKFRRFLAENVTETGYCADKGKAPLISLDGLNQLHYFVFLLAVCHVVSSITTVGLGQAKINRWKVWEQGTRTMEYEFSTDPARFRFTRQTTFGRRHMNSWARTPILLWIVCFFRQFFRSVQKVDYLTLRHGFINAHFAPHRNFDFRKYIKRSLEDDFKAIVSIGLPLWLFAVFSLLVNVDGWFAYSWMAILPLIILLVVGTKLQVIVTTMALEIQQSNTVVQGTPVVKPNDKLFWFGRPEWILYIINFTLFQNAFQFAFFFWSWYEYGLKNCFQPRTMDIIVRLAEGTVCQILCAYVTLPLYALVTQMGTHMKTTIFDERIAESIRRWHRRARRNLRRKRRSSENQSSGQTTPLHGFSGIDLLQNYRRSVDLESSVTSPRRSVEYELSGFDTDTTSPSHHTRYRASFAMRNITNAEEHKEVTPEQYSMKANYTVDEAAKDVKKDKEEQPDTLEKETNSSELSFQQLVKDNGEGNISSAAIPSEQDR